MEGNLQVFENGEFGNLRTVEVEDKIYFCGSDVAKALGYVNPNKAINDHCRAITKRATPISGKIQEINYISEGDVYRLIAHSKLPNAVKFESWVFDEVLPSIKKHGGYIVNQNEMSNEELLARALQVSQSIIEEKTKKLEQAEEKIKLDEPKVQFADAVSCSDTTILIRDLAKILKQSGIDIGQNRLFEYLRQNGYLIKNGQSKNMPTQKSMNLELFKVKERTIIKPDNTIEIKRTIMVTGKGQIYFINHFLAKQEVN